VKGTWRYILEMQKEVGMQGIINAAVLCIPAFLQANDNGPLAMSEISGWLLWIASLAFEHTADLQKLSFLQVNKRNGGSRGAVCDVGLWKYSRHPNYFGEWMVWNSLILASASSLCRIWQAKEDSCATTTRGGAQKRKKEDAWTKWGLASGLFSVSYGMYVCLTWWTGAIPAEHFSALKRPEFAAYVRRTSMFFPAFPRK
jgi:steroid 5-alpha reductase family enzyme